MRVLRLYGAFRRLTPGERRLFVEAAIVSGFVWFGLRTISFASLRRALDAFGRRRAGPKDVSLATITWAVEAVSRRIPGGRTCLVEALTADVMLRRRGCTPMLHLGVRKEGEGRPPIAGHAWVVCDDRIVVGRIADLDEYAPMNQRLLASMSQTSARSSQGRPW